MAQHTTMIRSNVVILGHSYVQRLANYMERHQGLGELGLHADVTGRTRRRDGGTGELRNGATYSPCSRYTDVVYLHAGESGWHTWLHVPLSLERDMRQRHGAGGVVIAKLVRFLVH